MIIEALLLLEMQTKKCAEFGFFHNDDYVVKMPPTSEYTVRMKVKSVEKGVPHFAEDELRFLSGKNAKETE